MNICIICNEYPPAKCGGIGIFTQEIAEALSKKGHKVIILGVYRDMEEDVCNDNGVRVIRLKASPGKSAFAKNSVKLWWKVRELIKYENIELVEVPDFEGPAAFWGPLKIPVIARLHGTLTYFASEMNQNISKLTKFVEGRSLKRADYICSVSKYTADKTKKIFSLKKEIKIIYNGVKIPDYYKTNYESTKIVSFSGSLMRKKGVLSLAKAWNIVKKVVPRAKLRLIGKDTFENGISIKSKIYEIVKNEYRDSLEFTGHVTKSEMEKLLIESDLAIYPSYAEAFSLAPLESLALAVPTIFSKKTSGVELGNYIDTLDLVDPDNIEEISDLIVKLLLDKELREIKGKKGREKVKMFFDIEKKIDENIEFYKECLK